MPTGILCGCGAVFAGGLVGTVCGKYISDETKDVITTVFGMAAVGNGIMSLIKGSTMPPVILALIVGTLIGQSLQLERRVKSGLKAALDRLPLAADRIDMDEYVTIVAIFCAGGFGIYVKIYYGFFYRHPFCRDHGSGGESGGLSPARHFYDPLLVRQINRSSDYPGAAQRFCGLRRYHDHSGRPEGGKDQGYAADQYASGPGAGDVFQQGLGHGILRNDLPY